MTAAPKKARKARLRRAPNGRPWAKIRPTHLPEPCVARYQAGTLGALLVAQGETPRLALEALEKRLREKVEPYTADAETDRLLSAHIKRLGQNPGGKPRRTKEASSATVTIRLTEAERATLKAASIDRGKSEGELVREGLRAITVLPIEASNHP